MKYKIFNIILLGCFWIVAYPLLPLTATAQIKKNKSNHPSPPKLIYSSEEILLQSYPSRLDLKIPFSYKLFTLPKHKKANIKIEGNLIEYYKDVVPDDGLPFPSGLYVPGKCSGGGPAPIKFALIKMDSKIIAF